MIDDVSGYIKLNKFSRTTFEEFKDAMRDLQAQGMEQLILDLRGNSGGYLSAAIKIADEFLSGKRTIVYTEGYNSRRKEFEAGKVGEFEKGKLIVMLDEGSASASEIVAGAVKDHKRATIVGRRSFGKGLVQEPIQLGDGSALRLTVARYYTPNGICIQRDYDKGIDAYYEDYYEVASNAGEVPDSSKGEIEANWGIEPHIIVKFDTSDIEKTYRYFSNRGLIRRYAYNFYAQSPARFDKYQDWNDFSSEFTFSNDQKQAFINSAEKKEESPTTEEIELAWPKIETALKAHIARQKWKNDGFFPIFHQIDKDFKIAYQELTGKTSANIE